MAGSFAASARASGFPRGGSKVGRSHPQRVREAGGAQEATETRESQANAFALKTISVGTVLANLLTIGGGIYLAILGHIWGAGIVIGGPLITVILNRGRSKEE